MTKTYKLKKGFRLVAYGNTKRTADGVLNNMFELQNQNGEELAYVGNLNVITTKYKTLCLSKTSKEAFLPLLH